MRAFSSVLFILLIAAAVAIGEPTPSCGTCDSLGYQCVSPSNIPVDDCGAPVNASTCPVTSCADYCLAMFSVTGGYCSPSERLCVCDTASACDRPLCDRLGDLYVQCIPTNATDECTDNQVATGSCPTTHPPCAAGCTCSPTNGVCLCPQTPHSSASPVGAAVITPVKAAAVPTVTRITTGSRTFVFGSGAIGGTSVQAGIAFGFMIAVYRTWYTKGHPRDVVAGI